MFVDCLWNWWFVGGYTRMYNLGSLEAYTLSATLEAWRTFFVLWFVFVWGEVSLGGLEGHTRTRILGGLEGFGTLEGYTLEARRANRQAKGPRSETNRQDERKRL